MHLLIAFSVLVWTIIPTLEAKLNDIPSDNETSGKIPSWDPNGYVFFGLCVGQFGYQVEFFLGGLAFAKGLNRTLVLPPFRSEYGIYFPFTDWIKKEPLERYHRVITAEDFMTHLAPDHWPVGSRKGFCYAMTSHFTCTVKDGPVFTDFWNKQGVHFDENIGHELEYHPEEYSKWNEQFPVSEYPVIAMSHAPALYPLREDHRYLQKYLVFNDSIEEEAQNYINKNFKDEKFVGIHLRNGRNWVSACNQLVNMSLARFAPFCTNETQCLPSLDDILTKTKEAIEKVGATVVFVATDKNPMIEELQSSLSHYKVKIHHMDPRLPQIDLAILKKSTWFVGNCVSSFTAYVKRHRDAMNKTTSYF